MHDTDHNGLPNNKVQVTIIMRDVQLESLGHKNWNTSQQQQQQQQQEM